MSRVFINRPITAIVLSIIIVIAGLMTLRDLPVAQYPDIAPPTVLVAAIYPGASASVLANTVAQPIEEQVNGVENMLYMSSTSSNNGEYALTVTFEVGTDLDTAVVQVQNRVAQATSQLPEEVQRIGLTTQKQSNNVLLFAALTSPDNRYDNLFLGNYASLRVKDELSRIEGVGDVMIFGASDYSMRIWLDPDKMKVRGLTMTDVIASIREQNVQIAAGQIGQSPAPDDQSFQLAINARGRLEEVSEFENIIVKSMPGDRMVRVKDIARVELGSQTYDLSSQIRGQEAAAIGIFLSPGANALEVGDKVAARMAELKKDFPEGLEFEIPFNTTDFVRTSINEVVQTLFIAVVLVFLTTLLFLQDWRATLIPAMTIPVSLIGTFAVMGSLGVSINMLSLFGLVLAIGVVVDDAIVVVENTSRIIDEQGLSPKEAARVAMGQVTGPIIATSLVLLVVFVPTAFFGGTTGQLYRQFAFTVATATIFSTINALTLSPALSGILLRPSSKNPNFFARAWNSMFSTGERLYQGTVVGVIRHKFITLLVFGAITVFTFWQLDRLPGGFLPEEDQGFAILSVQLPDAATRDRTLAVIDDINEKLSQVPGVKAYVAVPGFSLLDNAIASNAAAVWVVFDPWEDRLPKGLNMDAMLGQLWGVAGSIQDAMVFAFAPPAIMGLGNAEGFQFQLKDQTGTDLNGLQDAAWGMMMAANQRPELEQVFTTFRANVPQIAVSVDREHAKSVGTPLGSVYETLQASFGSVYVNDFNKFGRTYQVRVQADQKFRGSMEDIRDLQVRNERGDMVSLGSLVHVQESVGPQLISRYNMYPSAAMTGQAAPGYSSAQAIAAIEEVAAKTLPPDVQLEWTGISFQEKSGAGQSQMLFGLAVLLVYLVLCAQYESWSLPLAVILSVPLSLLGTVVFVTVRGMDMNAYTQIGIVLLVALACKTAILIAEFAKAERDAGKSILEAVLEASRLRLRPILMTASTFILGVVPLVIATGAGSASRQALGTTVFGGMLSATILLVVFVPVFYVVIQGTTEWLGARFNKQTPQPASSVAEAS